MSGVISGRRAPHFCQWVSRTPAVQNDTDTTVDEYGAAPEYEIGKDVDETGKTILGIGMRPMIWIKL